MTHQHTQTHPYPFFPFPAPQQPAPPSPEPPLRVQTALAIISHLSQKTQSVVGEGLRQAEAQELLPVERETQAAAMNLLTSYFKGNLEPCGWDDLDDYRQLTACPNCGGGVQKRQCGLCKGHGFVIFQG